MCHTPQTPGATATFRGLVQETHPATGQRAPIQPSMPPPPPQVQSRRRRQMLPGSLWSSSRTPRVAWLLLRLRLPCQRAQSKVPSTGQVGPLLGQRPPLVLPQLISL